MQPLNLSGYSAPFVRRRSQVPGSLGNKVNYEFHPDGYIIATVGPGMDFEVDDAIQLLDAAASRYGGPFGLISNRVHDYTIDLGVYEIIESRDDLVAMAVVLYHGRSFPAAKLETRYLRNTTYATFFELEQAEIWMRDQLSRHGVG